MYARTSSGPPGHKLAALIGASEYSSEYIPSEKSRKTCDRGGLSDALITMPVIVLPSISSNFCVSKFYLHVSDREADR
jgi:hypothetical protein